MKSTRPTRDIRRFARVDEFPAGRRVVILDPGQEVRVVVESTLRALAEVWSGDSDPGAEIRAGVLNVQGAGRNGQQLWRWLGRSLFAPTRIAARA